MARKSNENSTYHWLVRTIPTDGTDGLEHALNAYDELGWEIFDVDVMARHSVIVMRAPRSKERPSDELASSS